MSTRPTPRPCSALKEAGAAYRGFLPAVKSEAELAAVTEENAKRFEARGEPGAAEVARHLLDGAWQLERDLILIGSPDTVARKLKQCATEGLFDTFFGEFNFGNLPEDGSDALDPPLRYRGHAAPARLRAVLADRGPRPPAGVASYRLDGRRRRGVECCHESAIAGEVASCCSRICCGG